MLIARSERLRADLANEFGEFEARFGGRRPDFLVRATACGPVHPFEPGGLGLAMLRGTHPFRWITRGVLLFSVVRRILTAVRSLRSVFTLPATVISSRSGRNVAQSGSALAWGARGPEFKSRRSDQ